MSDRSQPEHAIRRVDFVSQLTGIGGPAGFQRRLSAGLHERGITVGYGATGEPSDALLVIGGTRRLPALARARRQGVRIVQRLDGINWLHRWVRTGLWHFLRAEVNNLLMRLVRDRYADQVVYQSEFARRWWEDRYGAALAPSRVVHNAVPLNQFSPDGPGARPSDRIRLLMVEANFGGGYEIGLAAGYVLARGIAEAADRPVELTIAGEVAGNGRRFEDGEAAPGAAPDAGRVGGRFEDGEAAADPTKGAGSRRAQRRVALDWRGRVDPSQVPVLYRSAHLLFSGDLNPACPNSVIEAMACGLPVVAYDTGALAELVRDDAGRLAPYGSDPWRAEPPETTGLVTAALSVLGDQERFRRQARLRAEAAFGLERMLEGYLAALFPDGLE